MRFTSPPRPTPSSSKDVAPGRYFLYSWSLTATLWYIFIANDGLVRRIAASAEKYASGSPLLRLLRIIGAG